MGKSVDLSCGETGKSKGEGSGAETDRTGKTFTQQKGLLLIRERCVRDSDMEEPSHGCLCRIKMGL